MDAEKLEKEISKQGIDPEKLEEKFSPGLHEKMEKYMAHKKHGFHSTHVEHHKDGSHTVHHHHEKPEHDVKHAVADLDGLHDSMEDHLGGAPNDHEAALDAGQHGIPEAQAGPAGLPGQVAAPAAGM